MYKHRVRQRATSDFVLAATAARIIGRSAASIRLYAHAGRLHATITEEGVHLFSRKECDALRRKIDAEQRAASAAPAPLSA